jgi:hypothetical protein
MRGWWILCLAAALPALSQSAWNNPPQTLAVMARNCSYCHIGNPKDRQFTQAGQKEVQQKASLRAAAGKNPKKAEPMKPETSTSQGAAKDGGQ